MQPLARPVSFSQHASRFVVAAALAASAAACSDPASNGAGDGGGGSTPTGSGTHTGGSTGGPGGSSGTGMMTVRPCDELPKPGTWENIAPDAASGEGSVVAVDPFEAGVVWMSAGGANSPSAGGLYRSSDCGATWKLASTGENATAINAHGLLSMVLDPVHEGTIYVTAGSNAGEGAGLWKSTNGGKDFKQLFPPESEFAKVVPNNLVSSIGMDAKDPLHLVVSTHADCSAPYGKLCEAETTDGGENWTISTIDIPGLGSWVAGAGAFILDESSWLFSTYYSGLWLTRDHGKTWKNVTAAGAQGSTSGKTIHEPLTRSADGNFYLADNAGVITSSDGEEWTLLPNSGGRTVGLTSGPHHLYSADQWSSAYHASTYEDLGTWSVIDPPPGLPADQGAPYLAFDAAHHVLYSSNWAGGAFRLVVEP